MDRFARQTGLIVLVLVAAGCATSTGGGEVSREMVDQHESTGRYVRVVTEVSTTSDWVAAAKSEVWAILPQVFEELGVLLSVNDGRLLLIGNQRFQQRRIDGKRLSRFLDCGSGAGVAS